MLDFLCRSPMRSFPRCRLVPRLVRASRGASRLFYPVVSLLARIVLISSRAASRRTSRFPVSSCLLVSFLRICVSRVASRPIPVSPFLRLVISSCWYVVLARLVFLFIRLIVLRVLDEMFLRGGVFPYQSDRYAARFLRLVLSLPARSVAMMRYSHPSCVIRS